ncbi:MAG: PepSY domain-containing protein [Pirellulales bacterium]
MFFFGLAVLGGVHRLPSSAKPLSAVLDAVATAGYDAPTEITYDDGRWEVEVLKAGKPLGLVVDPATAVIVREHADEPHPALPADAIGLRTIVGRLEKEGYVPTKVEFETTGWEIEAEGPDGRANWSSICTARSFPTRPKTERRFSLGVRRLDASPRVELFAFGS